MCVVCVVERVFSSALTIYHATEIVQLAHNIHTHRLLLGALRTLVLGVEKVFHVE